jgi:hemerythrin superfamily protein
MQDDDTPIDALELLRAQHADVESLIEDIEDSDDPDDKQAMFRRLADMLAAHATIEEKIFYPSVMAERSREQLIEATEEHLAVKRVLCDMLDLDPEDEHFDAKLTVLKEQVRHHAHDEEEDKLFPIVRKLMSKDELAGLGNEMLAMWDRLMERQPSANVPAETEAAAPLPAL